MLDFKPFEIFAPAKLNLYLHITGKRPDGYHLLDSLIVFTDIGDVLHIAPAPRFSLDLTGPFAQGFTKSDLDASPDSSNLIARAAWALARHTQKSPDIKVTLTKNLPMGAGLGGGSSNAAGVIWGLCDIWGLNWETLDLDALLLELGADVPVCLPCQSARVQGIGDILHPVHTPEIPVVIVYPGKPCPTGAIFKSYAEPHRTPLAHAGPFNDSADLLTFLQPHHNDLYKAARAAVPAIDNALHALRHESGCALARMSGSGASCFGLFRDPDSAARAAETIRRDNPDWWVKDGLISRPQRY